MGVLVDIVNIAVKRVCEYFTKRELAHFEITNGNIKDMRKCNNPEVCTNESQYPIARCSY